MLLTELFEYTWRRPLPRKEAAALPASHDDCEAKLHTDPLDMTLRTPSEVEKSSDSFLLLGWQTSWSFCCKCKSSWGLGPVANRLSAGGEDLPLYASAGKSLKLSCLTGPLTKAGGPRCAPAPGDGENDSLMPSRSSSNILLRCLTCSLLEFSSSCRIGELHSNDLERGDAACFLSFCEKSCGPA